MELEVTRLNPRASKREVRLPNDLELTGRCSHDPLPDHQQKGMSARGAAGEGSRRPHSGGGVNAPNHSNTPFVAPRRVLTVAIRP